jgi:hypothetical protein
LFLFARDTFAISNPDSISVTPIRTYRNVGVAGDFLVVANYTIQFATLPAETAFETFIAKFQDGNTVLATARPSSFISPFKGFNIGIIAFYFASEPTSTSGFKVVLQGDPSFFPTSQGNIAESSTFIDRPTGNVWLRIDTLANAKAFENIWGVDLIQAVQGTLILTGFGAEYFEDSIPRLREFSPQLFPTSNVTPNTEKRTFDKSEQNNLLNFWQGTSIDESFQLGADFLGLPKTVFTTLLAFGMILIIIGFIFKRTGSVELALLITPVLIGVSSLVGLVPLQITMVLAMFSLLALVYLFAYRTT